MEPMAALTSTRRYEPPTVTRDNRDPPFGARVSVSRDAGTGAQNGVLRVPVPSGSADVTRSAECSTPGGDSQGRAQGGNDRPAGGDRQERPGEACAEEPAP